jgi:hypothetical protein
LAASVNPPKGAALSMAFPSQTLLRDEEWDELSAPYGPVPRFPPPIPYSSRKTGTSHAYRSSRGCGRSDATRAVENRPPPAHSGVKIAPP